MDTSKKGNTFVSQKKDEIIGATDKAYTTFTGNRFFLWWGYLGAGYFITYKFVAPVLHSYFLIATGTNIIVFYTIILLIAFLISQVINVLLKILLALFR